MGNTVASEGEYMDDSPRVATGEISHKKHKHRSLRKRLADKFKKSSKKSPPPLPEKTFADEIDEVNYERKTTTTVIDKRRNYYKNLGIAQKGSRETERLGLTASRQISSIEYTAPERDQLDKDDREYKSKSILALDKAKAINETHKGTTPKRLKSSKSSNDIVGGFTPAIVENGAGIDHDEFPNADVSTKTTENTGTKNSLAEAEESKVGNSSDEMDFPANKKETNDFKINFFTQTQPKSDMEMRRKFLCKLTQEKIWLTPSEKPKAHQT